MESIATPPRSRPFFPTLLPEIIYSICECLRSDDLFNLLFTCKRIYPIAHKQLWRSLNFERYQGYTPEGVAYFYPDKWNRVVNVDIDRERHPTGITDRTLGLGWKHVRHINIGAIVLFRNRALCTRLTEKFRDGSLMPRSLHLSSLRALDWHPYGRRNDSDTPIPDRAAFLEILKSYSLSKSPASFSTTFDVNHTIFDALALFDTPKITKLSLKVFIDIGAIWSDVPELITAVTNLISSLPSLRKLSYTSRNITTSPPDAYPPWPIESISLPFVIISGWNDPIQPPPFPKPYPDDITITSVTITSLKSITGQLSPSIPNGLIRRIFETNKSLDTPSRELILQNQTSQKTDLHLSYMTSQTEKHSEDLKSKSAPPWCPRPPRNDFYYHPDQPEEFEEQFVLSYLARLTKQMAEKTEMRDIDEITNTMIARLTLFFSDSNLQSLDVALWKD
ncbi:hypothetical protein TWF481_011333 [Arthrobotrys musiformis]|uniref:F-box domain-containing protein n=1 Tax=Arthrobotrys musiformis TaxID=47236 RepID=A0AAV9VY49_9PEZI